MVPWRQDIVLEEGICVQIKEASLDWVTPTGVRRCGWEVHPQQRGRVLAEPQHRP